MCRYCWGVRSLVVMYVSLRRRKHAFGVVMGRCDRTNKSIDDFRSTFTIFFTVLSVSEDIDRFAIQNDAMHNTIVRFGMGNCDQ